MRNAYELREDYGKDGRCTHRERVIGPIVPWCFVAILVLLVFAITGRAPSVPSSFWQLFTKVM